MITAATKESFMDETRREVLRAIADTVVPGIERSPDPDGFWARRGSDLGAHEAVAQAIEQMPAEQREGLGELLDGLAQMGFLSASARSREQLLRNLATLGPEAIAGGQGLVQLSLFFAYGMPDPQTGVNPCWATFGYPGPSGPPEAGERAIVPIVPEADEATLEADAVVVGSGAGGGVIAASLAAAGSRCSCWRRGATSTSRTSTSTSCGPTRTCTGAADPAPRRT